MVQHYGKSIYDFFTVKEKFFISNDSLVTESNKLTAIYRSQRIRKFCKICESPIPSESLFNNHGTNYYQCPICGHINGEFDDGVEYATALYSDKKNDLYGSEYREVSEEAFVRRLDAIYVPKARFLMDTLSKIESKYKTYNYLDIGAGAGYMVGALDRFFVQASGVEVDENQVAYANKRLGKRDRLNLINIDAMADYIRETDKQVLTFIGVLEHITNLMEILNAIKSNTNIKYIFLSVPKIGLTCVIEAVFPEVWARHIGGGGGHTHLFTKSSLRWICEKYDFEPVASWDFGTDIMDLYRSLAVMLNKRSASDTFITQLSDFFVAHADAMQQIIDKTEMASETHMVLRAH